MFKKLLFCFVISALSFGSTNAQMIDLTGSFWKLNNGSADVMILNFQEDTLYSAYPPNDTTWFALSLYGYADSVLWIVDLGPDFIPDTLPDPCDVSDTGYYHLESITEEELEWSVISDDCGARSIGFTSLTWVYCQTLGVDELEALEVSVFPNPTDGMVYFRSERDLSKINVEVYDTSGRLFRNERLKNNSMDLRELPPGIYFLQIRNGKDAIIKQLIIE